MLTHTKIAENHPVIGEERPCAMVTSAGLTKCQLTEAWLKFVDYE